MRNAVLATSLMAAALTISSMGPVQAQSIAGMRIGDSRAQFNRLRVTPSRVDHAGAYIITAWHLADGNQISATTSKDGRIVYLESDWGGHESGAKSDFPSFVFGRTTLAQIRRKLGNNGIEFEDRPPTTPTEGGVALLNSYQAGQTIITFVTKVLPKDFDAVKRKPSNLGQAATLDALILADPYYARVNWGTPIFSPNYKAIEWK